MRIVFMGNSADYSLQFLEALTRRALRPADPVTLVAVVCPQRFSTRQAELGFLAKRRLGGAAERLPGALGARARHLARGPWSQVQRLASAAGAGVFWPRSVNDPSLLARLLALGPDLVLVAGLDQILKEPLLAALPPIVNFHPSLLPDYRGGLPEFWQLDANETVGGVTAHRIERGVDTGPIVAQRSFAIAPWLDAEGLIARAADAGAELMGAVIDGYPDNARTAKTQEGGSYQPFPRDEQRAVPFSRPARGVFDRARAVGFRSPLFLHVPRSTWEAGEVTRAVNAPSRDTRTLRAYDPVAFEAPAEDAPGTVARVAGGGVAVSCAPGTVVFRRFE